MTNSDQDNRNNIIRANLLLHNRDAYQYDARHTYIRDAGLLKRVREDVSYIQRTLNIEHPYFLDLGAGTGFLSRYFCNAGFQSIAIDISQKMLKQLKSKIRSETVWPVAAEIDGFLDMTPENMFHVIGISSTLHHMPEYTHTLKRCCELLLPGGFIYILNEPPMHRHSSAIGHLLDSCDELMDGFLFKLLNDPRDIAGALIRRSAAFCKKILGMRGQKTVFDRLQLRFQRGVKDEYIDINMAEQHSDPGIDTKLIKTIFQNNSMELIDESYYSAKRIFLFRRLETFFPGSRFVRLLARKTSPMP